MSAWIHLTVEAVEAIHQKVLAKHGGSDGLRDRRLLESAVNAPQATMMGKPLFEDGIEIAAAYLLYLCQNHPFVDGNKRTALATCLIFLEGNGLLSQPDLNVDQWEDLTLRVASGQLGRDELTDQLRALLSTS